MATSGSTDFNRTGLQIITFAAKLLQVIPRGGSLSTAEVTDGTESLNLMIKTWGVEGLKLWIETEGRVFTVDSQAAYSLPGANGCKISELSETTLDADEAASQTVLSVTSTTQGAGFTDADTIGIVLDDDTIHWTTIASSVTDDTVTVDTGLASAAASGNKVFAYTNAIERPLQIISARRLLSGQELSMFPWTRQEYFDQPNKTSAGTSTQYFYDPQLTTGKLYLWQPPDTVDQMINITYKRTIEDFDADGNNPDFPQEWLEALGYNLAIRMAPQYGKTVPPDLLFTAQQMKEMLEDWSQEEQSIYFTAGSGWRR